MTTIDQQKLQRLIDELPNSAAELKGLRRQHQEAVEAFKLKSSKGNTTDLKKISAQLGALIDSLWSKHFPNDGVDPESFKTQRAAVEYLKNKGFEVSEGTLSGHIKQRLLTRQQNKSILLADLVNYAANHLSGTVTSTDEYDKLRLEDVQLDVDIKRGKLRKLELENRKEDESWMQVEEHEVDMAGLINIIRDALHHRAYIDHLKMIQVADGNTARAAETLDALHELIAGAFNDVAKIGEADVLFEDEEDF